MNRLNQSPPSRFCGRPNAAWSRKLSLLLGAAALWAPVQSYAQQAPAAAPATAKPDGAEIVVTATRIRRR